ncbi:MAG: DUF3575 domain-containing protein [Bacteroidetes bacterium HGW-Bacteroidetes-2]|jgi:hypothetical protein|nr:MAG: DUF3575 domain-containing protein [Bacteroidetes bacterium HGW-Bacteroidetes-2]
MKYVLSILTSFLLYVSVSAQDFPNNEIKFNIANTIIFASIEVGYEYLFDYNQSIDAEVLINDRINFHSEEGSQQFNTTSAKLGYNFYFGTENPGSGLYFNPFVKYRFGDFEEDPDLTLIDSMPGQTFQKVKTDMNTFIIGIGSGYKWNFSNSFIIALYGSIGRNFSDEIKERFEAIEFHAGLGIGYRF